jgi:hypothetical protein
MSFTAGDVFELAAAVLNDQVQAVYTDAVQMPYLNIAILDLKRQLQLNNVPVTNDTSAVITIPANTDELEIGGTTPCLPADLIEIQQLWQRWSGTENPFLPIQKFEFLPHYWDDTQTSQIPAWSWIAQKTKFISANIALDLKVDYIADIIPAITDADDEISVLNAMGYLVYQTAGHCAMFIGSNESRASVNYTLAKGSLDEILGISSKGRQSIYTRRRPFMAAYKNRGVSY